MQLTSLSFLRDHLEDVTPQALHWMALTDRHENVSRRLRASDDEVFWGRVETPQPPPARSQPRDRCGAPRRIPDERAGVGSRSAATRAVATIDCVALFVGLEQDHGRERTANENGWTPED